MPFLKTKLNLKQLSINSEDFYAMAGQKEFSISRELNIDTICGRIHL